METIRSKFSISYREKIYIDGKVLKSPTFRRKTDAKLWKQKMSVEKSNGSLGRTQSLTQILFVELVQTWLIQINQRCSSKTVEEYRSMNKNYLIPFFGQKNISNINLRECDQFVQILKEKRLSNKTINMIVGLLKQQFIFAEKQELIDRNPIRHLEKLPSVEQKTEFLTAKEVEQLLKWNLNESCYSVIFLAVNTGMRLSEICGLKWDRVNFQSNQIEVTRTYARCVLKETTKTKAIRFIPMNSEVKSFFLKLSFHKSKNIEGFVCLNHLGHPFSSNHFCNREFEAALAQASVRKVRFHDLRHTYASHFMMNGGSLYDLQKILGHTKFEMTTRYAHLSQDHLQKASNVVVFGGSEERASGPILAQLSS